MRPGGDRTQGVLVYKQYNLIVARVQIWCFHVHLVTTRVLELHHVVHGFSTDTLTKDNLVLNISIMALTLIMDLYSFRLALTDIKSLKYTRNLPKMLLRLTSLGPGNSSTISIPIILPI